ncbi:uncharacterized protein LOC129232973, partial [Uloborus diversus]|uniref:uncharacterized protein LOC129232973 n=1 Tax=Uloborus diversus TaxID=327109 RepID=UPI00240A7B1C
MSFSSKHCESDFSEERLDDHSPTGEIMCEKECSPNSKKVLSFDKSAQEQSNSVSSTDNNVQSESPVLENYETKLDTMNMDVNKSEDTEDQKSVCNAECSHSRKEGDEINQNVIKNVPEEASENQVLNDSELKLSAVIEELKNLEIEEIFAPKIVPETDFNEELQQTNKIICAGNKATVSCETELCSSENIQKDMHEESNDVPETLAQSTVEDAVTQDMNKSEVIGHDASDTETVEEENESCKMKVQIRRSENFAYEICSDTDSDDELQMTNFICAENKATVSSETEQGCSEKNLQQDMHEESNDVPEILAQSTDEDEVSPSANKGDHDCFDTSPAKEKDQSYKMKIKRRAANVKSLESFRSLRITSPT